LNVASATVMLHRNLQERKIMVVLEGRNTTFQHSSR